MFDVAENVHSIMDDKIKIKKEYFIFFYVYFTDDDQTTCKFLN